MKIGDLNYFQVVFGDYYNDGHGKFATYILKSTLSSDEFENLIKDIKDCTNIDFENEFCVDYEEDTASPEDIEKLKLIGFDFSSYIINEDGTLWLDSETFKDILLYCIKFTYKKLYNNDLILEVSNEIPFVKLGIGYGIFND